MHKNNLRNTEQVHISGILICDPGETEMKE